MIYLASPIHSKIKLFAENTSIFPVVYDTHKNADNITKGFETISKWSNQYKMNFYY